MQVLNGSATVNDVPTFTQNFSVVPPHAVHLQWYSIAVLQHALTVMPTNVCV